MKSKKNNLTTGIIIGIGMIVVPLILMGTTNINTSEGKYQGFADQGYIYMINTETGELYSHGGGIIIKRKWWSLSKDKIFQEE